MEMSFTGILDSPGRKFPMVKAFTCMEKTESDSWTLPEGRW